MAGSVEDFMNRFGGNDTVDDQEAQGYFDRFASREPQYQDFDNDALADGATEYLGKLPDDEFQSAARDAYRQAPPQEQEGLLGGLLGGLQGQGLDLGALGSLLGLSSNDPRQMGADDYSRIANYTRRQHPDVMRKTVQEKPWFVKALGNPMVIGALGYAATRLLNSRRGR